MKESTAQQLLALNQTFYARFAGAFADSRANPQPGYWKLVEHLPDPLQQVLDVGCGNGRWGSFLIQQLRRDVGYTGVDFSAQLVARATEQVRGEFLLRNIAEPDFLAGLPRYELVVCLSTMQHIPGQTRRLRLLAEMAAHLTAHGRIFLANWQFMDSARQRRKVRPWSEVGLDPSDVDPGDYLLSWQRDGLGLRYACILDEEVTVALARTVGLQILDQFRSDGREGNLNLYTVLAV